MWSAFPVTKCIFTIALPHRRFSSCLSHRASCSKCTFRRWFTVRDMTPHSLASYGLKSRILLPPPHIQWHNRDSTSTNKHSHQKEREWATHGPWCVAIVKFTGQTREVPCSGGRGNFLISPRSALGGAPWSMTPGSTLWEVDACPCLP